MSILTKRPKRRRGNQVKRPKGKLTFFRLLGKKVVQILFDCNAPSHWGDKEARLLLDYCMFPGTINAAARLFIEDPDSMCKAVLKLRQYLRACWRSPRRRLAMEIVLASQYSHHAKPIEDLAGGKVPAKDLVRRQDPKTGKVEKPLGETLGWSEDLRTGRPAKVVPITEKVIEHARKLIREGISPTD